MFQGRSVHRAEGYLYYALGKEGTLGATVTKILTNASILNIYSTHENIFNNNFFSK